MTVTSNIRFIRLVAQHKSTQVGLSIAFLKALLHEAIFLQLGRQVADEIATETPLLRNLSRKDKLRCELQEK